MYENTILIASIAGQGMVVGLRVLKALVFDPLETPGFRYPDSALKNRLIRTTGGPALGFTSRAFLLYWE